MYQRVLRTREASDPRAGRRLAGVGAVLRQGTAAARVVRATRQGCMTPALGLNVLLAGKPRPQTKLQPAAARRSSVRAGRPPLRPRRRQLTRTARSDVSARTRFALAPLRGRFERLFNASEAYLRDTPPTRRESCAALVDESGVARIAPPSRSIRRRINATENRGVVTG